MNAHARQSDAVMLGKIRAALDAIAPGEWNRACDGDGELMEACGPMGERLPVLRFHPGATRAEKDFVANAPLHVRFLLGLVDRAIAALRQKPEGEAAARHSKDYAAEAAMKCQEPAFLAFLRDRHGLESPLTPEKAAQKVRSLCGVTSRRELNENERAARAWNDLRAAFEAWKRTGR
jgi:hypothetical protein